MAQDSHVASSHCPSLGARSNLLGSYITTAVAAGVGFLSMVPPAAAEVVVTHKTIPILIDSETGTLTPIDLNGDGINDISFGFTSFGPYGFTAEAFVAGQQGRGMVTGGRGPRFPLVSALRRGDKVGPSAHFSSASTDAFLEQFSEKEPQQSVCSQLNSYGHWAGNNPDRFVGLKFEIHGKIHYGWVRVTIAADKLPGHCRRMTATITAYAYETVADRAITIGGGDSGATQSGIKQSGIPDQSLGTLALGAPGLPIWRRE